MGTTFVIVALNFTPVPREGYRIGVPRPGRYRELFNSDSPDYAGSGLDIAAPGPLESQEIPWMNRPHSLAITLPPLAGIVLSLEPEPEGKVARQRDRKATASTRDPRSRPRGGRD